MEQSGTFILPQRRVTKESRCGRCSSHQADHRRAGFAEEFCDGRILPSALPKESSQPLWIQHAWETLFPLTGLESWTSMLGSQFDESLLRS